MSKFRTCACVLVLGVCALPASAFGEASHLTAVRFGVHETFTRVVLDIEGPLTPYSVAETAGGVEVRLQGAYVDLRKTPAPARGGLVRTAAASAQTDGGVVRLGLSEPGGEVRHFTLATRPRVIVDIYKPGASAPPERSVAIEAAATAPAPAQTKDAGPAETLTNADLPVRAEIPAAAFEASEPEKAGASAVQEEAPPAPTAAATPTEPAPAPAAETTAATAAAESGREGSDAEAVAKMLATPEAVAVAGALHEAAAASAKGAARFRGAVLRRGIFEPTVLVEPIHRMLLGPARQECTADEWALLGDAAAKVDGGDLAGAARQYAAFLGHHPEGRAAALASTALGDVRVWQSLVEGRERQLEAVDAYKRAEELDPSAAGSVAFRAATAHHMIEFLQEAKLGYEEAARAMPGTVYETYAEMELAKLELRADQYYEAFERLQKLVARTEGDARRDALLLLAEANFANQNYFFALESYRAIEAQWPGELEKRLETYLHFALTQGRNGFYESAIARLERILDRLPRRPDLVLQVGDFYRDLDRPEDARAQYESVAAAHRGEEPGFLAAIALAELHHRGAPDQELALAASLEEVYEEYKRAPYADRLLYRMAVTYMQGGDELRALDRASTLLRRFPDSELAPKANVLADKAALDAFDVLVAKGDDPGLVRLFQAQRARYLGAFRKGHWHWLASRAMDRIGSEEAMLDAVREAGVSIVDRAEREPFEGAAVEALYALGRGEEADAAFDAYMKEHPKGGRVPWALAARGRFRAQEKRWRESAEAYDQAALVAADPALKSRALLGLGAARRNLDDYDGAVASLRQSIVLWPRERRKTDADRRLAADGFYELGLAHFSKGDMGEALLAFRESRALSPDPERVAWARLFEARALDGQGKAEAALEVLDALSAETQDDFFRRTVDAQAAQIRWAGERRRLASAWKEGT